MRDHSPVVAGARRATWPCDATPGSTFPICQLGSSILFQNPYAIELSIGLYYILLELKITLHMTQNLDVASQILIDLNLETNIIMTHVKDEHINA